MKCGDLIKMSWEDVLKEEKTTIFKSINDPDMNSKRLQNAIDVLFEGVRLDELEAERMVGSNPLNPNKTHVLIRAEVFLKELLEENEEDAKRLAEKRRQRDD